MRLFLFLLLIALPAGADSFSCTRSTAQDGSFTLSCMPAAVVTPIPAPPPLPPTPVGPPAPPAAATCPSWMNPVMCAMMQSGGAQGGGNSPQTTNEQPDFRDGSVHRFPGRWDLVADRDATIEFNGGEIPGAPGLSTVTLTVDFASETWTQQNTLLHIAPRRVSKGARIALTITGAPMEARLAVR